ncbi:hypothetical protein I551_9191 [Mycobacterium ulcerans str. Harvey]|uniref:Uncharacterized protein n=1 Tax=Mycobacterium ulcerans str. Harvey TaxID=1299332 RepID=A0ABP3AT39_MYCUL|nr:hypothetical protein I551_9191 [Mycobacterium ulcerans str. Harvey]
MVAYHQRATATTPATPASPSHFHTLRMTTGYLCLWCWGGIKQPDLGPSAQ